VWALSCACDAGERTFCNINEQSDLQNGSCGATRLVAPTTGLRRCVDVTQVRPVCGL